MIVEKLHEIGQVLVGDFLTIVLFGLVIVSVILTIIGIIMAWRN